MFVKNKIGYKIGFWVLMIFLFVYIISEYIEYSFSKQKLVELSQDKFLHMKYDLGNKIESILNKIEKEGNTLELFLRYGLYDKENIFEQLYYYCRHEPDIVNAVIAFEPGKLQGRDELFSPLYRKDLSEDGFSQYHEIYGEYLSREWYDIPLKTGRSYLSPPFHYKNLFTIIYSRPIFSLDNKEEIIGVLGLYYSIMGLHSYISNMLVFGDGILFLIDEEGKFIFHKDRNLILRGKIQDFLSEDINSQILEKSEGIIRAEYFFGIQDAYIAFLALDVQGWTMGFAFPEEYVTKEIIEYGIFSRIVIIAGSIIIIIFILLFSRVLSKNFTSLSKTSESLASGDFDINIPHMARLDEIGIIARSFEKLRNDLMVYIDKLKKETAYNERISKEIEIASAIQKQSLAKDLKGIKENEGFSINARLIPAKIVSGDFYDYFLIDNDNLYFAIGDVSDKGIPASLFMMVTKYILKLLAKRDLSIEKIMEYANRELCEDNELSIFITLFCGILNLKTGALTYCNAGHNPPYLVDSDGFIEELDSQKNMALGIMTDITFQPSYKDLKRDDLIFAYTDGLTEARGEKMNIYGEERVIKLLEKYKDFYPKEIIDFIIEDNNIFSCKKDQFDDITIIGLKYHGRKNGS